MTIKGRYQYEKDTYDNRHCSPYGFYRICSARNGAGCTGNSGSPKRNVASDP